MKETIISVEVNRAWVEERERSGQAPFADIGSMLETDFPGLEISVAGHRMQVRNTEPERNARIRESIKQFFNTRYSMSIDGGDFRLSTKVRPIDDAAQPESPQTERSTQETGQIPLKAAKTPVEADDAAPDAPAPQRAPELPAKTAGEREYLATDALERFLEEFQTIHDAAKRFGMTDIVWQTNLLVSIDSGYGLTTATERIADLLERNGFRFSSKTKARILEYVLPVPDDKFKVNEFWEKTLKVLTDLPREDKEGGKRNPITPLIVSLDISECMGPSHERELHERLLQLARCKGSFLYVFRIPYVEETALATMYATLSDVFLIRRISIPPYSNEILAAYLRETLQKRKLRVEDGVEPILEKLILKEKQDGRFSGLKAVGKLANEIVYNKLARSTKADSLYLTREDLDGFYDLSAMEEEDPERALAELCGMDEVRRRIEEIAAQIQSYLDLKKTGRKLSAPTMHMRFVGNPGTGKTTVARLVAQLFRKRGILKKGFFYEIKARDLCGRYIGETAPKTSQYCRDALGSVLFIDEAYTLYRSDSDRDYGREAIDTLITEMEINRDNLVVIMAGYEKEMNAMMEWNPGLASRMPYEIRFRNYTREELTEILFSMIPDGFSYSDGFERAAREFILAIPGHALDNPQFGNARMIRNFYERVWSKAAYRRSGSANAELMLSEEDVHAAAADEEFRKLLDNPKKTFGF